MLCRLHHMAATMQIASYFTISFHSHCRIFLSLPMFMFTFCFPFLTVRITHRSHSTTASLHFLNSQLSVPVSNLGHLELCNVFLTSSLLSSASTINFTFTLEKTMSITGAFRAQLEATHTILSTSINMKYHKLRNILSSPAVCFCWAIARLCCKRVTVKWTRPCGRMGGQVGWDLDTEEGCLTSLHC